MDTPSRMKGTKPIKIHVHSVMEILDAIHELGHTEQFRQAAKEQGAYLSVHPQTVNFVKDYLAANDLHTKHAVARNIADACPPRNIRAPTA